MFSLFFVLFSFPFHRKLFAFFLDFINMWNCKYCADKHLFNYLILLRFLCSSVSDGFFLETLFITFNISKFHSMTIAFGWVQMELHYVHPTCFEAGKPMEFVVCGSNLVQPKFRYGILYLKKMCFSVSVMLYL